MTMTKAPQSGHAMSYDTALSILGNAGVFTANDQFRDGHTVASFAGSSIDVTGSPLVQREVSDQDWMRLFGHLLAAAADRGLRPGELLAIGMATVLQGAKPA